MVGELQEDLKDIDIFGFLRGNGEFGPLRCRCGWVGKEYI
jgi:hypothetical protein